jgi:hypothetical protein
MNTENLNLKELETLRTLLNKMAGVPQPQVYFNPVNLMIDEIMDEFNFAQVQNVMNYLDWKWVGEKVTIEMLRESAERLLRDAAKLRLGDWIDEHWEQGIIAATGGFQAKAFCNEDKTKITGLELKFVLTEWDAKIEN